ncbi:MAG: tetratricopeptide repeat protein [Magnetococcales bacterium]|nr:tetratricopeptide repeat protein [Magnetococcales bacterium]
MNEKKTAKPTAEPQPQPQLIVEEAYKLALKNFNSQCYTESDQLCTAIIKAVPNHVDAINLLGVIAQKLNRHDLAVEQFARAIKIDNSRAMLHYNMGISLDQLGEIDKAFEVLLLALQKDPHNKEVITYFNGVLDKTEKLFKQHEVNYNSDNVLQLGIYFHKVGRLDKAEIWYKKSLEIKPENSIALCNYATALKGQGRVAEAIINFKKAITIQPDYGDAHSNLGIVLLEEGEFEVAVSCLQKAISLNPNCVEAFYTLGSALYNQGRFDDALASYNKAVLLKPDYYEVYLNIAKIKKTQGKLEEAVESYQKAIAIQPDNPISHNNLGNIYKDQGKLDRAIACYKKAIIVDPNYVLAYNNLGDLKVEYGDFDEGVAYFQQAIKIQPRLEYKIKLALSQSPIISSVDQAISYREKLQKDIAALATQGTSRGNPLETVNITNFYSAYHGLNERTLQKQIANLFQHSFPILYSSPLRVNDNKNSARKLRIGFLSSYLYGHTIGYLNIGIIKHLNRERFEIVVFRLPDNRDELSQQIDLMADKTVAITRELEKTKQIVLQEKLDVLYYPDIGMCPFTYYLAFYRLALVQCTTLGHPITTGIPNMDYFISTECMEPKNAQQHYSETLYLLKRLPCYYYPAKLQEKKPTRGDFSLPSNGNIYVCSQTLYKLHPDFDLAIMDILTKDPNGWVVFISGKHDNWEKLLRKRWSKLAVNRAEKILFLPRLSPDQFISLFQIADVVLDTFHFSGGKTTSEALSVGAPVVTLPGTYMRGRITLACYKLMGVMDLVAQNAEEYVDLACRLANEPKWRENIVNKIKANSHHIIEDKETVREFERFFETSIDNS